VDGEAGAGALGRTASENLEMMDLTSDRSDDVPGLLSVVGEPVPGLPAGAVGVPPGGAVSGEVGAALGVVSDEVGAELGVDGLPGSPGSPGLGGELDGSGASTLPRMIGMPSLPLPMTTILVFGDCARASVA
jgi:hypothetical protein